MKWITRGVAAAGIAVSFFALPASVSAPIAIAIAVTIWFLERIGYRYNFAFFHVGGELLAPPNTRLGFIWGYEGKAIKRPAVAILYQDKKQARLAFSIVRQWNFGRYLDENGHIRVSIVREGGSRYTAVLYPGDRDPVKRAAESRISSTLPSSDEVAMVAEARPYLQNSACYADRPRMIEFMESLPEADSMYFNTAYLDGDTLQMFSGRPIRFLTFSVIDRDEVGPTSLEGQLEWEDPQTLPQDLLDTVKELSLKHS